MHQEDARRVGVDGVGRGQVGIAARVGVEALGVGERARQLAVLIVTFGGEARRDAEVEEPEVVRVRRLGRAERAEREDGRDEAATFEATARAVASLPELLEYVAPLVRPEGLIAFPKGSALRGELGAAGSALKPLRCEVVDTVPMRPDVSETLSILLLRRTGEMPATYPRRAGIPAKRPL